MSIPKTNIPLLTDECARRLAEDGFALILEWPSEFDHAQFLSRFGRFVPQYDGNLVWAVRPDPRFDNFYHSCNTHELFPHTECYEFPGLPPHYLALWCVTPAGCGGGQTQLADSRPFFAALTEEECRRLAEPRYRFVSASGIRDTGLGSEAVHPIYDIFHDRTLFRFSRNCIDTGGDPEADALLDRFVNYFHAGRIDIDIPRGGLLIWDNWRMAHARTAFHDRSRHLNRVWIADVHS